MEIAFLMDRLESINPVNETTSHLMYECNQRGHTVYFLEPHDVYIRGDEVVARMRNVTDDVLRHLAINRGWTKSYTVIKELVSNPRTPQTVSANFIPRMTNRDLRELARSREVPELIRRMAKRTYDTRTQKREGAFKKK